MTPLLVGSIGVCQAAAAAQPFPPVFEVRNLDGKNGFVVNGVGENDVSGSVLAAGGDINGDGIDDLLVSGSAADANGDEDAGEGYVLFGEIGIGDAGSIDLAALDGTKGFVLHGVDPEGFAGTGVGGNVDVDGDGFDDVIIGAVTATPNQRTRAGQAYVVFGGAGSWNQWERRARQSGRHERFHFGRRASLWQRRRIRQRCRGHER